MADPRLSGFPGVWTTANMSLLVQRHAPGHIMSTLTDPLKIPLKPPLMAAFG